MGSNWQSTYSQIPMLIVMGQVEEVPAGNGEQGAPRSTTSQQDPAATGTGQPAGGSQTSSGGYGILPYLLPIFAIFIFMMWTSSSSQKKEKRRREEMLAGLQRHDKVQTIGGVIGSVIEVKDGEVVLKVDESNNIKMRFARSAIQTVLSDGTEDSN